MTENTKAAASNGADDRSLYEECIALWGGSVAAPALTNLRILARKGNMLSEEDANQVLNLPVSCATVVELFLKYKDALLQEFSHDPGIPFHIDVFENIQDYCPLDYQQVVVFDDENRDSELVYGIVLNRAKGRIILTFRGSVTKKDYEIDFNVLMKQYPNPNNPSQKVRLHAGFSNYLLGKNSNGKKERKFDVILGHLRTLLAENPEFRVYVCGHSLGGSLAILAAFYLASIPDIPSPVTAITYGPLLVGDLRFRRAFQALEQEKRVHCLCVVNDGDLIPLLPYHGGLLRTYRHVGVMVMLFSNLTPYMTYAAPSRCCLGAYLKGIPNQFMHFWFLTNTMLCRKRFWTNHSVIAYSDNLAESQDLKTMTMNDVYERHVWK